jgi:hypothetical protein
VKQQQKPFITKRSKRRNSTSKDIAGRTNNFNNQTKHLCSPNKKASPSASTSPKKPVPTPFETLKAPSTPTTFSPTKNNALVIFASDKKSSMNKQKIVMPSNSKVKHLLIGSKNY